MRLLMPNSCQNLLPLYATIIDRLKSVLTRENTPHSRTKDYFGKPWFDEDCINSKKDLTATYKRYTENRTGSLNNEPSQILKLKKNYKNLLACKKKKI